MKTTKILLILLLPLFTYLEVLSQNTEKLYIPQTYLTKGKSGNIIVHMDNIKEITRVEFTLVSLNEFTIHKGSENLSDRAVNFKVTSKKINTNNYRYTIFSTSEHVISGNSGELLSIPLTVASDINDTIDYQLTIIDAVLSSTDGQTIIPDLEIGKISFPPLPNLHITSLNCSDPVAGNTFTIKWVVANHGRSSTGDVEWNETVWIVPDVSNGSTGTGSKKLGSVKNVSALKPGEYYENTLVMTLPEKIYGNYDLLVAADMSKVSNIDFSSTGGHPPYPYDPINGGYGYLLAKTSSKQLFEQVEPVGKSDNFFYKRIEIAVPPLVDLLTTNVAAVVDNSSTTPTPVTMAGLASSTAFYSGKQVIVTANVKNQGGKDLEKTNIYNALYICSTNDLSTGKSIKIGSKSMSLALAQDESVNIEISGQIPYDWSGDTYFIINVDENDKVYELANKENNICSSKMANVLLTPGADFEPYNLIVPSHMSSSSSFDITYSVKNIGPGVPYVTQWTDKLYISSSKTGIDKKAKLLGSYTHKGNYKQGQGGTWLYDGDNYTTTHNIKLNSLESGTYYLYVSVDANNSVFEYDGEDNNILLSGPITLTVPDLTVELISISEDTLTTGSTVAAIWKIKNIGDADIINTMITDQIYACKSQSFSGNTLLAEISNIITIASGEEKTIRSNFVVPKSSSLSGERFVYVRTNSNNSISETNTNNNRSNLIKCNFVDNANITTIGKNLTLEELQVPSEVIPGSQIQISYNVKNTGSETIDKDAIHEIWISQKSSFAKTSATLCQMSGSPTSLAGLTSTKSQKYVWTVSIPDNIQGGPNYLFVVLDRENLLGEKNTKDNILKSQVYLNGNLQDLAISDVIVPTVINTGEKTQISWKVSNVGSWQSKSTQCNIYLSNDNEYDSSDIKLIGTSVPQLNIGASTILTKDIEINDGIVGNKYLILKIAANVDLDENNNYSIVSFVSKQSPLPDLTISELFTEGKLKGGQTITINATISNIGDHATRVTSWQEKYYLSSTKDFNPKKYVTMVSKSHNGLLDIGHSYNSSVKMNIPTELHGDYYLFAMTDAGNKVYEKNEDNDTTSTSLFIQDAYDTPCELVVKDVSLPTKIKAGESISVSYTIENSGTYVAEGELRDVIYLSKDTNWDKDDEIVGIITGDVYIEPGEEMNRSATGRIINIKEGNYYVFIRTNSVHNLIETDFDNNTTMQSSPISISFASLDLGATTTLNTSEYYKLDVPMSYEGKTIGIYLSHPEECMAGLYSSYERVPSTATFDWQICDMEKTEQELLIPNVKEGTYYILAQDNASIIKSQNIFSLDNDDTISDIPMTISSKVVPFGASSLSHKEGGNGGWLTTEIHGALLDSIMDFRLVMDNKIIPAESVIFKNSTASMTTFNLNDAETGFYDIISELPNGTATSLPNGFQVIPGISVNLGVKLDVPGVVLAGSYAPMSIAFANGGNTDIAIREILVEMEDGYLAKTIDGLKEEQSVLHIISEIGEQKRGFITIPPATQKVFNCFMRQNTTEQSHIVVYVIK